MKLSDAARKALSEFSIPRTASEAASLQLALKKLLRIKPLSLKTIYTAVALDVSYDRKSGLSHAAAVVFDFQTGRTVKIETAASEIRFPYIPGLLAFREIPALLEVLLKLDYRAELILCEGHGIAHPRGFGLASHLGVILGLPSVGVAKKLLYGSVERREHLLNGFTYSYIYDVETRAAIGAAIKRRNRSFKPVFVSPGHLVDVKTSILAAVRLSDGFRLPPQLRLAHKYSRSYIKGKNQI